MLEGDRFEVLDMTTGWSEYEVEVPRDADQGR